jgi:ribosomal protein S18
MAVTGLLITPENKVSVGRDLKRKIRVLAHKAKNEKITPKDLNWLRGMIAFVASIEPRYVTNLRSKYHLAELNSNRS